MNIDKIKSYLDSSSTRSICIDRRLLAEYPGYVRDITIQRTSKAKIEFNVYGYDEGGLTVVVSFHDLQTLVEELERYMCLKLEKWENIARTGFYPPNPGAIDLDRSGLLLKSDLASGKLHLPQKGTEYFIPKGYWRDIAEGKIGF